MKRQRVLIVEDDAPIREGIADALECAGYGALQAGDGEDGLAAALGASYDLLLLDLVLPHRDGFEILRNVRERRPALPVIILTARGEETDRVRGLNLGADDYVVKPFSVRELLARVAAVLRRAPDRDRDLTRLEVPRGVVDFETAQVEFDDGTREVLSDRELGLLRYLSENAGRTVTREELLARVWGLNAPGIETRTIDIHIGRVREKLRDDPSDPHIIATVRGRGYRFQVSEGAS